MLLIWLVHSCLVSQLTSQSHEKGHLSPFQDKDTKTQNLPKKEKQLRWLYPQQLVHTLVHPWNQTPPNIPESVPLLAKKATSTCDSQVGESLLSHHGPCTPTLLHWVLDQAWLWDALDLWCLVPALVVWLVGCRNKGILSEGVVEAKGVVERQSLFLKMCSKSSNFKSSMWHQLMSSWNHKACTWQSIPSHKLFQERSFLEVSFNQDHTLPKKERKDQALKIVNWWPLKCKIHEDICWAIVDPALLGNPWGPLFGNPGN